MGNLVTTVGQDGGESGLNQLLGSSGVDPDEPTDLASCQQRAGGDRVAEQTPLRGRCEARKASVTRAPLGRQASLTATGRASALNTERRALLPTSAEGGRRRQSGALWNPRPQLRLAAGGLKRQAAAQSPSSPPASSLAQEESFPPGSSWEEQRILPQESPAPAASSTEQVRRHLEGRLEGVPALPVDAIINGPSGRLGSGGWRRLSHFKRSLVVSGLTLALAAAMLTVFTWKLLQEPLGYDVARNASQLAQMLLVASVDAEADRANGSLSAAVNYSAPGGGGASSAATGADGVVPLF
ncbi:uncharacterized protein LOC144119399 [Amblyomma americanum]